MTETNMKAVDDAAVDFLREDQLSLGIVLGQFLKTIYLSVILSCWMCLRLMGTLPGMIVMVLLIAGLVSGVIQLPTEPLGAWKVFKTLLFVIGGSALLLSLFGLFAILIVPPVVFEKDQVVIGSSRIAVSEITRLKLSEWARSRLLTICYEQNGVITEMPINLVRNEATQRKLDVLQAWCTTREISVEMK
ncbi:hypothetical protein [Gimesia sp.]|uniref:hypothetical protein n=1 Tax=Gimesia sp. TaxID=2024833 RepID=UPI003A8CECB5